MAVRVVEALEAIDVADHERERLFVVAAFGERLLELRERAAVVREAGERIGHRTLALPLHRPFKLPLLDDDRPASVVNDAQQRYVENEQADAQAEQHVAPSGGDLVRDRFVTLMDLKSAGHLFGAREHDWCIDLQKFLVSCVCCALRLGGQQDFRSGLARDRLRTVVLDQDGPSDFIRVVRVDDEAIAVPDPDPCCAL